MDPEVLLIRKDEDRLGRVVTVEREEEEGGIFLYDCLLTLGQGKGVDRDGGWGYPRDREN